MLLLAMLLPVSSSHAAAPGNDNFAAATVLDPSGFDVPVDTIDATSEPGEPNHYSPHTARHTVWYRWTPDTTRAIRISTANSDFDTVLAVYTGSSLTTLTRVDSADDSPDPMDPTWSAILDTTLIVHGVAGTTYSIAVDGYGPNAFGTSTLRSDPTRPLVLDTYPYDGARFPLPPTLEVEVGHEAPRSGRSMQVEFEVCSISVVEHSCVDGGGTLIASGTSSSGILPGDYGDWDPPPASFGTYYWHARAVDDLGLAGTWSDSMSFEIVADVPDVPWLGSPGPAATASGRPLLTAYAEHPRETALMQAEFELCTAAPLPAQTCTDAGGSVLASGLNVEGPQPPYWTATWSPSTTLAPGAAFWRARVIDDASITSDWAAARAITIVAGPANDDFANAEVLTGTSATANGSNGLATVETGEPPTLSNTRSLWYAWTAPANGSVRFDSCGSTFDGMVAAYTGSSVGALTLIDADDDGCAGLGGYNNGGIVQFTVTAGTTYRLRTGGYGSAAGNVTVNLSFHAPPVNDHLAAATAIGSTSTMTFDLAGATREPDELASFTGLIGASKGPTIWYAWTAPRNMTMSITPSSTSISIDVGVFTGSSHATLTKAASDRLTVGGAALTWSAVAGTTYRIGVMTMGSTTTQTLTMSSATSIPAPATVLDGSLAGEDVDQQQSTTTLHAAWSTVSPPAPNPPLDRYETCFSSLTNCAGTILQPWTSQGSATSQTLIGQSLTVGDTWFVCVRAIDTDGDTSQRCSDGVTITAVILPDTPTMLAPSSGSFAPPTQQLAARFTHDDSARSGTIEFRLCSDAACTTILETGSSSGVARGTNGTWNPTGLVLGATYWWQARAVDDMLQQSSWTAATQLRIKVVPSNDAFANATIVTGTWTAGTTIEATFEAGEPKPYATTGSIWFTWTAPGNGSATIDTCTSPASVMVYTGSSIPTLGAPIDSDTRPCGSGAHVTAPDVNALQTYRIQVSSVSGTPVNLRVQFTPTVTPVNDNFDDAVVISGLRTNTNGTTVGARSEPGEPEHARNSPPRGSVWYTWIAPADMATSIRIDSPGLYMLFGAAYTGPSLTNLTPVSIDEPGGGMKWDAKAGTTYYIAIDVVHGYASPMPFTLNLNPQYKFAVATPLNGVLADHNIDQQTDTTALHATWPTTEDPLGLMNDQQLCVQQWIGPEPWDWPSTCTTWISVGTGTSGSAPHALVVGATYRVCLRATTSDGYTTPTLTPYDEPECSSGVQVVASLSNKPPPPTLVAPRNHEVVMGVPTLVARVNFNGTGETGTLEFETSNAGEGCEETPLESGQFGPGLGRMDEGTFATTNPGDWGEVCWRARTIDSSGTMSEWSEYGHYSIEEQSSIGIEVEQGEVDAGPTVFGADAAAAFSVFVDTQGSTAEVLVNDDSDTVAATCDCGDTITDFPFFDNPEYWGHADPDYAGMAGLTVLDYKGDSDRRPNRWGDQPASGATLAELDASYWVGLGGPSEAYRVGLISNATNIRFGYRVSPRAGQTNGTYRAQLTFTALPYVA